ncbi:hypothetical protein L2E82_49122 [Cichorium intybus]|uniref:Uncharacterized protein n=1 Tax=Cichorium intybus TaxID=13427 RepID=A0ACB8Z3V6_CICIN|nr:hypothetical protein L2E82_49122 [Cichorium intybus]
MLGDVSNWKEYRKEAILRWRKKTGRCAMFRSVILDKQQYRRNAIIRWKLKRKKHSSLSTFPFFGLNQLSDVLMDNKQYRKKAIKRWKKKMSKNKVVSSAATSLDNEKTEKKTLVSGQPIAFPGQSSNLLCDVLMDKKEYRSQAIERWKKKPSTQKRLLASVEKLISPVTAPSAEHLLDMEENVLGSNRESSNIQIILPGNRTRKCGYPDNMMLEDLVKCNKYTLREAKRCALQQVNYFLQSIGRQLHEFDVVPHDISYNELEDETRDIRAEKRDGKETSGDDDLISLPSQMLVDTNDNGDSLNVLMSDQFNQHVT